LAFFAHQKSKVKNLVKWKRTFVGRLILRKEAADGWKRTRSGEKCKSC
jgi:hypothetical protein